MILNTKNLLNFVITNDKGSPAQVGYDLTIEHITQIQGGIITQEKSKIKPYQEVETDNYDELEGSEGWYLPVGVYSLTFEQGIKLGKFHSGKVVHRSSLLRSGSIITSGIFDPGFACDKIGATLFVFIPITIEKGSRIAQIIIEENQESEEYNGQYQGDKDRK